MSDPVRVLYVDDDSGSLEVRADMLEQHGFEVVTETSVADAKRRLAETGIDCVLSDLKMPDEDGFDMLAHVRSIDPNLAFILFTSDESEDVVDRALDAGATDYVAKSMTTTSHRLLAHRIRQAVRIAEADGTARQGGAGDGHTEADTPQGEGDSRSSDTLDIVRSGDGVNQRSETASGPPDRVSADAEPGGETDPDVGDLSDSSADAEKPSRSGTGGAVSPAADPGEHGHPLPETFDPAPGDGVLVECGSQDERKRRACADLLGLDDVEGRNVLLIRYRRTGSDRLRRIAEDAKRVHLISIGYRESVPDGVEDAVETTHINNPGEMTRLGIVMTRAIGQWETDPVDTVVCLDSLDILMGYTDVRSAFRFLHVLLSKLRSAEAIAHFHIDHSDSDTQAANTLKPLFDSIVTIDDDGVHIE